MAEASNDVREAATTTRRALRVDAIASGFVGALALAVSTYNVYLQREQIRAQVWPHLEWSYSDPGDATFQWNLSNTGVGPARIHAVRFTVNGKPAKDWQQALDLFAASDPARRSAVDAMMKSGLTYSTFTGRVIGAGVEVHPLGIHDVPAEARQPLRDAYEQIRVDICYCSTLNECWMLPASTAVRACPTEGYAVTNE
jgi:hypothetical protein